MHIKDLIAAKFVFLALHLLALSVSVYSRANNIWSGLTFSEQAVQSVVTKADNEYARVTQSALLSGVGPHSGRGRVFLLAVRLHDDQHQTEHGQ